MKDTYLTELWKIFIILQTCNITTKIIFVKDHESYTLDLDRWLFAKIPLRVHLVEYFTSSAPRLIWEGRRGKREKVGRDRKVAQFGSYGLGKTESIGSCKQNSRYNTNSELQPSSRPVFASVNKQMCLHYHWIGEAGGWNEKPAWLITHLTQNVGCPNFPELASYNYKLMRQSSARKDSFKRLRIK